MNAGKKKRRKRKKRDVSIAEVCRMKGLNKAKKKKPGNVV